MPGWRGDRGSPLRKLATAGKGEGRFYMMKGGGDQKTAKKSWWPKTSSKMTFKNPARSPIFSRRIIPARIQSFQSLLKLERGIRRCNHRKDIPANSAAFSPDLCCELYTRHTKIWI